MDLGFVRREFGERFVENETVASLYTRDASMEGGWVLGVVFPVDEEVVELVCWAVENRVSLFPQGAPQVSPATPRLLRRVLW